MPDLDQLFDTLIADVNSGIRAPGAPAAIRQAHHRSRRNAVAAVAAVALIGVGGAVTAGTLAGGDRVSPIEEPTLTSPEPSTLQEQESPTASPNFDKTYWGKLGKAMTQVPGWAITATDPAIIDSCGGNWTATAEGGSGGPLGLGPAGPPVVQEDLLGFSSPAKASDAADLLLENLASCTALEWQTQPIAQADAVIASSAAGVIWIVQKGATVVTLQVPTTDGLPPLGVQVEVADIMLAPID